MSKFELQYQPYGERSILIEWPQSISKKTLKDVLFYKEQLEKFEFKEKVFIKSAYNSLLVTYKDVVNNFDERIITLKSFYSNQKNNSDSVFKLWKIPVCYDLEFGLDLEDISIKKNIKISKIIQLHTDVRYPVYFLGFLPGFLYLGGLEKQLYFSRKSTPRMRVNRGSIAIGGSQTGIYPNESPGGWNIIGSTPINFFNINSKNPCFATAGDQVEFVSISRKKYDEIRNRVEVGDYLIENRVIND